MNGPCGVFVALAPGMPIAAGICRAEPFTNTVRCAWMWNTVCSAVWQLIPSTAWPVTAVAVPASGAADGIGTPSAPAAPAAGAGWRFPSVLSAASGNPFPELPPLTASVMPTAAAMTTTAAPAAAIHRRRRRRRASSALIRAIRSLARCLPLLLIGPPLVAGSAGAGPSGPRVTAGRHGCPDDPGVVEHGRGDDAGPDTGQPRHPLLGLPADPAAHDNEVGRQQRLDVLQVLIDMSRPLAPALAIQLLGAFGGAALRVAAADLDVPELGVRHQDALDEQRAADPGAEGHHQHGALLIHPRPERHLGHPGRVDVVEHPDRVAGGLGEQRGGVQPDPGRVHVGGGPGHAVGDHTGEGDADRAGPVERGRELLHHVRHRVGQRWVRRVDLLPFGQELAGGHVDRGGLDAGTADVNAECVHGPRVMTLEYSRPSAARARSGNILSESWSR